MEEHGRWAGARWFGLRMSPQEVVTERFHSLGNRTAEQIGMKREGGIQADGVP